MLFAQNIKSTLLALSLCLLASTAYALPTIEVPEKVSQGRAFELKYKDTEGTLQSQIDNVFVTWQGKRIPMFIDSAKDGLGVEGSMLLAMPIGTKTMQDIKVEVISDSEEQIAPVSASIMPMQVTWSKSTLSVDPKFVVPPKEYWDQIAQNKAKNTAIFQVYSPYNALDIPLVRSVPGTISSGFGTQRMFNGELKSVHSGTDYRGATGTPIRAVADGLVVLAEPQYYYGNNVIVNHGQGVYTIYSHLSKYNTQVGEVVHAGDIVGEVGMTGRVTGPHLHLGLVVQGVSVDIVPLHEEDFEVVGGPTLPQARK